MIRNDYAILPMELLIGSEMNSLKERCESLSRQGLLADGIDFFDVGLFRSSLQFSLGGAYLVQSDYMAGSVGPFSVYLVLLETSACFVIHRAMEVPAIVDDEARKSMVVDTLRERRALHQDLLGEARNPIQRIAPQLDGSVPEGPSYAFSFFIYEGPPEPDEKSWESSFKFLAEPASLGLEADEDNSEDISFDYRQIVDWTLPDIEDIDPDSASSVYITWSTIVACVWGSPRQVDRNKTMLLGMEIKLQSAWNKCYSLSQQIDRIIVEDRDQANADLILIGFTQALESVRGTVSATVTTRYQAIFDRIRVTSRIDEQIDVLDRRLSLIELYIERRRNRSEASFQRRITFILGLVAIMDLLTGATAVITGELSTLSAIILSGTGVALVVILAGFSFRWWSVLRRVL